MDDMITILDEIGIPYAYEHFAQGESPATPFITYLIPRTDNVYADGRLYIKIEEVHLELYTDRKDLSSEKKVEDVLEDYGIFYEKTEVWIESERLYEVLYSFERKAEEGKQ